jgi:hypothetical protein
MANQAPASIVFVALLGLGACAPGADQANTGNASEVGNCPRIPMGTPCNGPCSNYCEQGTTCAATAQALSSAWQDPSADLPRICRPNAEVQDELTSGTQGNRCYNPGESKVMCSGDLSCVANVCQNVLAVYVTTVSANGVAGQVTDEHNGPSITATLYREVPIPPSYMDLPTSAPPDDLVETASGVTTAAFSASVEAGRYYILVTDGTYSGKVSTFDYGGASDPSKRKPVALN